LFKIGSLFSGSSGNSFYISNSRGIILIDIGRSAKQIENSLKANDLNPSDVHSIFITHEHLDHVSGLRVFIKKYSPKIYGSLGTINELLSKNIINQCDNYHEINVNFGIDLEDIFVKSFRISHDCAEGFGYTIEFKNSKIAFCSDLGYISENVFNAILGSNIVFLESNHSIDMLKNGSYPVFLKERILSHKGHLSNGACAGILPDLFRRGTTRFVLCHLSSENNTPEIAYQTSLKSLQNHGLIENKDFEIRVAPKESMGKFKILI
jgi:phosphoribosyl 1,2-cyclic phosphodiesterase